MSDLSLSPSTNPPSRSLLEFVSLLGDIDDAAIVVVAGNLFHPDPTSDLAKFVDATLRALPEFAAAMQGFCARDSHQLVVLPGSDDYELRDDDRAQGLLRALGIEVAADLVLQIASASGVRDLVVAAGSYGLDLGPVDPKDRADADRLDDPRSIRRFAASRVLYRRFAPWLWLPIVLVAVADLWTTLMAIVGHFTHHRFHVRLLHTRGFWPNLVVDLIVVTVIETIVAALAGWLVRRRFERSASGASTVELSDPLALTHVGGVDALELARRVVERGGVGAVIGGAPRPALAFLDRGVSASPGPSRTVLFERLGRFGLPPVFSSSDRLGVVEIEAASTVQVRLFAGATPQRRNTFLERLFGGAERATFTPQGHLDGGFVADRSAVPRRGGASAGPTSPTCDSPLGEWSHLRRRSHQRGDYDVKTTAQSISTSSCPCSPSRSPSPRRRSRPSPVSR